jgi:hypothetical protein
VRVLAWLPSALRSEGDMRDEHRHAATIGSNESMRRMMAPTGHERGRKMLPGGVPPRFIQHALEQRQLEAQIRRGSVGGLALGLWR